MVLPYENLCFVDETVGILAYADAKLCPLAAQNVLAVAVAGHEGGLRFCHIGMVGNILAPSGELVSVAAKKVAGIAEGGGLMGEVIILVHISGLDACDPAKLGIQGQGGQAVAGPVLVE